MEHGARTIRFIRLVVLIVVAIVLLHFAFANRQFVSVSFDGAVKAMRGSHMR